MSRVLEAFEASRKRDSRQTGLTNDNQDQGLTTVQDSYQISSSHSTQRIAHSFQWLYYRPRHLEIGVSFLSGALSVEFPASDDQLKEELLPSGRRVSSLQQKRPLLRLEFRLPTWLTNRVLDFIVCRSQAGWISHLVTYNVVPKESQKWGKAKELIKEGNITGLRQQFERRDLTPFDYDDMGNNLFYVSVSHKIAVEILMDFSGHLSTAAG